MPGSPKTHRIFVSHSHHADADNLHALEGILRRRKDLKVYDNSLRNRQRTKLKDLKSHVRKRIQDSNVMIVFCGPKSSSSEMIEYELDAARKAGVPIIGLRPPKTRNVPSLAQLYTKRIIDWDEDKIVNAIKNPHAIARATPGILLSTEKASAAAAEQTPREVIKLAGPKTDQPPSPPVVAPWRPWWKRALGLGKSR